jgi:hypothetical protein
VYQKVIEFYQAVCDILSRKGSRLVMKMILENDRLPSIVQDFLRCSDILHNVVQTTTLRITQDIHSMLLDEKSEGFTLNLIALCDLMPLQFSDG